MKILTRYILKEMIGPTLLGFSFYTSIIIMQKLFDMAGMIIRRSLTAGDVGNLLLLSLPHIVVLTVPMSILFGILIAIGRLSADSEIIAMRALGISTRTIYIPVFIFTGVMFFVNFWLINDVLPRGNSKLQALQADLLTSSVAKEIRPRVFYDEYENLMIYVNDLDPLTGRWKGVFLADSRADEALGAQASTPQAQIDAARASESENEEALGALAASRGGQRVVTARSGTIAVHDPTKEVWMTLEGAENHVWDPRRPDRYDRNRNEQQRILLPLDREMPVGNLARSLRQMTLRELVEEADRQRRGDQLTYNLARVEIHKKFAIPFACLAFGILGLPLGITNRRGGKSSGFSLSIAIILFYYVAINNGEQLAASGKLPPWLGMWGANLILLGLGLWLLNRANRDLGAQRGEGGWFKKLGAGISRLLPRRKESAASPNETSSVLSRLDITFPNILDRYILREFLKVLALVLVSVLALFIVIDYNEIARDVRANNIKLHTLAYYYRFQVFQVLNWTLPISVLVATLVCFGMLAKNNEITAIKSGGVSLFRVALPIIAVAMGISVLAYFVLDFILPYSNRRVDELRRKIEGKPQISAQSQQKLWFLGKGEYVINFLGYDARKQMLSQVQVFEYDRNDFRLTRRVYAPYARWNGKGWEFSGGWIRSFLRNNDSTYSPMTVPLVLHYSETPDDFATEVKSPDQMTYAQLRIYIDSLRKSGYAAEELSVKLYTKTSWPALSIVMALIALPFAFRSGKKGALYGVGIALILGIAYWLVFALFTKFGEVGNLPPLLSAWAANILFAISAIYMFLHVET